MAAVLASSCCITPRCRPLCLRASSSRLSVCSTSFDAAGGAVVAAARGSAAVGVFSRASRLAQCGLGGTSHGGHCGVSATAPSPVGSAPVLGRTAGREAGRVPAFGSLAAEALAAMAGTCTRIAWPGCTPAGTTSATWPPYGLCTSICWPGATPGGTVTCSCTVGVATTAAAGGAAVAARVEEAELVGKLVGAEIAAVEAGSAERSSCRDGCWPLKVTAALMAESKEVCACRSTSSLVCGAVATTALLAGSTAAGCVAAVAATAGSAVPTAEAALTASSDPECARLASSALIRASKRSHCSSEASERSAAAAVSCSALPTGAPPTAPHQSTASRRPRDCMDVVLRERPRRRVGGFGNLVSSSVAGHDAATSLAGSKEGGGGGNCCSCCCCGGVYRNTGTRRTAYRLNAPTRQRGGTTESTTGPLQLHIYVAISHHPRHQFSATMLDSNENDDEKSGIPKLRRTHTHAKHGFTYTNRAAAWAHPPTPPRQSRCGLRSQSHSAPHPTSISDTHSHCHIVYSNPSRSTASLISQLGLRSRSPPPVRPSRPSWPWRPQPPPLVGAACALGCP